MLFSTAACRGTGVNSDDWTSDVEAIRIASTDGDLVLPPRLRPEPRASGPSPLAALLSRMISGSADEVRRARRVHVEPVPILGDHEVGFGLTVHW